MARNSTNTEDKQPRVGKCIDCAKGYVMSDGVKENPLIIECTVNPYSLFPGMDMW